MRRHQGFTLVEVLVALLVLAFSMLGVAAMNLKAAKSSHLAYQRSVATIAANDAVERLWAEMAENGSVCPSADTGDALSQQWFSEWEQHLPGLIHDADTIKKSGCVYTVTVQWVDERFSGEDVSTLEYIAYLPGKTS